MSIANPGASIRVVTLYKTLNGTTYDATTQWGPALRLLAGEAAMWCDGAWMVFNANGIQKNLPSPLTAKGDLWGFSTVDARVPVSADGGVLCADSADAKGLTYLVLSAKGDLIAGQAGAKPVRLPVGTDWQSLAAVAADASGLRWYPGSAVILNQSVSAQGAGFAAETYLVGSSILIPAGLPIVGTKYRCRFDVSKTGAGTATPIIRLYIGPNGSTADTVRLTFTFSAGTANADVGTFEVTAVFRTVGSGTSAVLQGRAECRHGLSATTGLVNLVAPVLQVTSGGFDSTPASGIIGLSVNGGTSAVWTVQLVEAELLP
jgi:hypothetical protein